MIRVFLIVAFGLAACSSPPPVNGDGQRVVVDMHINTPRTAAYWANQHCLEHGKAAKLTKVVDETYVFNCVEGGGA
jgi:hypothetical protein